MLFLLCEVENERYALDVRQIAEVLPLVHIQRAPQAPAEIAGLLNYRGVPVPVVHLSVLLHGRPAALRASSRVVILRCVDPDGATQLIGLVAEHAIQTIRRDPSDFLPSGIGDGKAAATADAASGETSLIQWLDVDALLPASLRERLSLAGVPA
jgi:chemotaxis-related protein WspB